MSGAVASLKRPAPRATPRSRSARAAAPVIDLERYTPAFFTFIANTLARGASAHYLETCGVGIETWRLLVMLAIETRVTAQKVVQVIGIDKASVSRCFKTMHEQGFIGFSSDDNDGRLRHATITPKGRALHDRILRFALLRERVLLSVLSAGEVETLLDLLRRVHANLPAVEAASDEFMRGEKPTATSRKARRRLTNGR